MRHLGTLIAAIVIAPLAWILLAFGQERSVQAFVNAQNNGAFDKGDFVRPLVLLAVAGVLLGLIGTLRLSPLGAAVTGVVYLGSYLALLINPRGMLDLLPHGFSVAGRYADPTTPLRTGSVLVLGALLLLGAASSGRWRRWPGGKASAALTPEEMTPPEPARPLGADGLGLTTPDRSAEPDSWPRYEVETARSVNTGPHWPDLLRDDFDETPRVARHSRRPYV
jgi:hypothetical protein